MKLKHKTRTSKDFPKETDRPIPDSWVEQFVVKQLANNEALLAHKERLADLCRDYHEAAKEYHKTFRAFDHLRFTRDKDGNVDGVFAMNREDYMLFKECKIEFLLNLQNALADRGHMDDPAYKAVMAEIHRRVESGAIYPNKELPAA